MPQTASGQVQADHTQVIRIRPKLRYCIISSTFPILVYIGAIVGWFFLPPGYPWAKNMVLVILGLSLLTILWSILIILCTSWTLTADQLCYRRGVIARRTDYLELYRVTDYAVKESVAERLLALCSFYVVSTDAISLVLRIFGIPNIRELQTEIRARVEIQRQTKRIYEIGNNPHC